MASSRPINGEQQTELPSRRWSGWRWEAFCFSKDGRYLVQLYDQAAYLWSVPDGECVGVVDFESPLKQSDWYWIDCAGILRDANGQDVGVRINDPQPKPAWVTGAKLFRSQSADGHGPIMRMSESWEIDVRGLSGAYDDDITFACPVMWTRGNLPPEVIKTVDSILRKANVNGSPVLELPDEAWDDERLDFECDECHRTHRSTPFYVDSHRSGFNTVS